MTAIRKTLFLAALAFFVLVAAIFAYANPDPIDLDLGFARLEDVSMTAAFASVFSLGALFGMGCGVIACLRAAAEKRLLLRRLKSAEAEASRLRNLPLEHAD